MAIADWLKALRDKGLKYSSLANYCNSLFMVASYVYEHYTVDEDARALPVSPLSELYRIRAQCEGQAKQQQLCKRTPRGPPRRAHCTHSCLCSAHR